MEKTLLISLKLNFTPNTLGCYGLTNILVMTTEHFSHHNQQIGCHNQFVRVYNNRIFGPSLRDSGTDN